MSRPYTSYTGDDDFAESKAALDAAQAAFSHNKHEKALAEYARALDSHPHIGDVGRPYAGQAIAKEVLHYGLWLFQQMKNKKADPFLVAGYLLLAERYSADEQDKIKAARAAMFALDEAAFVDPPRLNNHAQIITYARRVFLALPASSIDGLMFKSEVLKPWTAQGAAVHKDDEVYGGTSGTVLAIDALLDMALKRGNGVEGVATNAALANIRMRAEPTTDRLALN